MNLALTGIPDTDIYILLELEDQDLINICQVNNYVRNICNKDSLWISKLYKKFANVSNVAINNIDVLELLKYKPNTMNYKDFYITIVNNVNLCIRIRELLEVEIYVYDDFYVGELYITDPYIESNRQFSLLYILMNKMNYENFIGTPMALDLELSIEQLYSQLPDFYKIMMTPGTEFTDLDKKTLREFINEEVTEDIIKKHMEANSFNVAQNRILENIDHRDFVFLIYIHDLIRTNTIPVNITWRNLCSNIYVLLFGIVV